MVAGSGGAEEGAGRCQPHSKMAFHDLYDSCFRDLPVVLLSKEAKNDVKSSVTTLDHVVSSSQFVIFFSGSGSKAADLSRILEELVKKKNGVGSKEKSHSSPARLRRFFGLKKKKSSSKERGSPDGGTVVSVIRIEAEDEVSPDGWFGLAPSDDARVRSRLLRSMRVETNPSIIVVECSTRRIVTADGRRLLSADPAGIDFPWRTPASPSVLTSEGLIAWADGSVEKRTLDEVAVRALLFGASWYPPCREWVKQLAPIYEAIRAGGHSLEIIFCSSDRTEEAFNTFLAQMPWLALPYNPSKAIALTRIFNVNGIPSLVLLDQADNVISRHGLSALLEDPKGDLFPWASRPLYELNEHSVVSRLREEPSLILFTEGSPDDVRFSVSVLREVGENLQREREERDERAKRERTMTPIPSSESRDECSSTSSEVVPVPSYADPLQVFYTGDHPICDHILEQFLGLGEAELPLLVIVDDVVGVFAVCEEEDVSRDVIDRFVAAYKAGKLQWNPIPTHEGSRIVGGIPSSVIAEAVAAKAASAHVTISPSHTSIGDSGKENQNTMDT